MPFIIKVFTTVEHHQSENSFDKLCSVQQQFFQTLFKIAAIGKEMFDTVAK